MNTIKLSRAEILKAIGVLSGSVIFQHVARVLVGALRAARNVVE